MTQNTFDIIHCAYQQALERSGNILEIVKNLYDILSKTEVSSEDSQAFDSFIDGLRGCYNIRQKTFLLTNEITYINITLMYIIYWLNQTKNMAIDIDWSARRKSLESDLRKILRKSLDPSSYTANIRDRFGLRGIILNDFSEEKAIEYIYCIFDAILGILAGKNRKMRREFIEWYEHNNLIPDPDKGTLSYVLDIPFCVDYVKNYIVEPKQNNYKTLQFTMLVPLYSKTLPGLQLEIQLRSKEMHKVATIGSASHIEFKKGYGDEQIQKINEVFVVDDFSKLQISGFYSYENKEDDKDGIHFSKEFASRRISPSLVF